MNLHKTTSLFSFLRFSIPILFLFALAGGVYSQDNAAVAAYKAGEYQQARALAEADLDDAGNRTVLAFVYLNGKGVEQDVPAAIEHLEVAATLNHVPAIIFLGKLYQDGVGNLLPPDPVKALAWYTTAAGFGQLGAVKDQMEDLSEQLSEEEKREAYERSREWMMGEMQKRHERNEKKKSAKLLEEALRLEAENKEEARQALGPSIYPGSIKGYEVEWLRAAGAAGNVASVYATLDGGVFTFGAAYVEDRNRTEVYVTRFNKDGILLWEKYLHDGDGVILNDVLELESGDFILAGSFDPTEDGESDMHAWAGMLSRDGELLWKKDFGDGRFNAVSTNYQQPVVLGGVKFIDRSKAEDLHKAWVVWIDTGGHISNQTTFGSGESSWVKDLELIFNQRIVMVGSTEDMTDAECFDMGGGTLWCNGTFLGWVVEMDGDGLVTYSETFGGPHEADLVSLLSGGWWVENSEGTGATNFGNRIFAFGDRYADKSDNRPWLLVRSGGEDPGFQYDKTFSFDGEFTTSTWLPDGTIAAIGVKYYDRGDVDGDGDEWDDTGRSVEILSYDSKERSVRWSETIDRYSNIIPDAADVNNIEGYLYIGGSLDDSNDKSWDWVAKLKPKF